MRTIIAAALLLGPLLPGGPAQAQPAPDTAYRYLLPLDVAVDSAMEAIRVCADNGYRVTATSGQGSPVVTVKPNAVKAQRPQQPGAAADIALDVQISDLAKGARITGSTPKAASGRPTLADST